MPTQNGPKLRVEISLSPDGSFDYPSLSVGWVTDNESTERIIEPKGLRSRPVIVTMSASRKAEYDMSQTSSTLSAREVADYFLASVDEDCGDNITNLKLQKLVYYAQGFHLAMNNGKALFDDPIVAWAHGPVVPTLYHGFKSYGANAIPRPQTVDYSKYSDDVRKLLDEVSEVYGQFSASRLRAMTHEEPPWMETPQNDVIPLDLMRNYFETLLVDGQR
jgi:uncharacterized phage-associated protein